MITTGSKILSIPDIERQVRILKFLQQRIVFTNGCFDLLHPGHISYLEQSRNLGDVLIVGVNSDDSVRRLKGPHRPIQNQQARAQVLAALLVVSYVVIFEEDTPLTLIEKITPDVLTKGGDYEMNQVVGSTFIQSYGGRVEIIPFVPDYSTTRLIEKSYQTGSVSYARPKKKANAPSN
jgi:D-beta-D-heptose 7-phosphate kinase/D-beta-D-heptose 1-phosphate adenosyltransferase